MACASGDNLATPGGRALIRDERRVFGAGEIRRPTYGQSFLAGAREICNCDEGGAWPDGTDYSLASLAARCWAAAPDAPRPAPRKHLHHSQLGQAAEHVRLNSR